MKQEEADGVRRLAESLVKNKLASSIADATRQAKQMLGIDEIMPRQKVTTAQDLINSADEIEEEKKKEEQKELEEDFDITKSEKTVNQLLAEEKK
jgi:hypothetical protein